MRNQLEQNFNGFWIKNNVDCPDFQICQCSGFQLELLVGDPNRWVRARKREFLMKSHEYPLKVCLEGCAFWASNERMIDILHKYFENQAFDLSFLRNPIIKSDTHAHCLHQWDKPIFLPTNINDGEFSYDIPCWRNRFCFLLLLTQEGTLCAFFAKISDA